MVQAQYWKEIYQLKAHIGFIELLLEKAEKIDRGLKMFLAVTSSASIGAWVIWNEIAWVWASIIALSQVISAISIYLPYKSRMKSYSSLLHELEELMIQAELKWHAIAEGELTSAGINIARFKIRSAKQKILKKHVPTTIPEDEALQKKSEELASLYFNNFYPGEENI